MNFIVLRKIEKCQVYVVLSSVEMMKGLLLYNRLSLDDVQAPNVSYLREEMRLKQLESSALDFQRLASTKQFI